MSILGSKYLMMIASEGEEIGEKWDLDSDRSHESMNVKM